MNIQIVDIDKLNPAKYNPRIDLKPEHKEYKKLGKSIKEFGYIEPIVVNSDMTIIGGHQRYKILREQGFDNIEVVIVDVDKVTEKAMNLSLNKNHGDWDMEALESLLEELSFEDINLEITGFDNEEIEKEFKDFFKSNKTEEELNEIPEPKKETVSKPGDLFLLNNKHRIICEDCTNNENIIKLMGEGNMSDLLITDPPYNVDYKGKTKDALTIENDNMSNSEFRDFLVNAFKSADLVLKKGGVFYIWHADSEGFNFRGACSDVGWQVRQCLIWSKNCMVMGRQDYHWKHEPCLYGWKDGAAHLWNADRKQTTILEFNRPSRNEEHPTMKPVDLFAYQITNNTKIDEKVLDIFLGSGTSLIACEENQRTCFGMEKDPVYIDVILRRYHELYPDKKIECLNRKFDFEKLFESE